MEILYQGVDITEMVQVSKCVGRDVSGNRCDSLDIEFENAAGWYSWGPEEDDQIIVTHDGYNTGVMFVNTILPEEGRYRILATSLPCSARIKGNQSFYKKTIEEIVRSCAINSGMGFQIYGIDAKAIIPYIERRDEGCAAFLHRLMKMEGAVLKCTGGMYTAIGIEYAQAREPHQTIEIAADQSGTEYQRCGQTLRSLTVMTPFARATAQDKSVPTNHGSVTDNTTPAQNDIQAGRWARGLLIDRNRQCERLRILSEYNIGFTAMTRIDIEGGTDADGEWLIEEAEHDFINLSSTATLRRCINTIE